MRRFGISVVLLGSTLLFSIYLMTRGSMPDPERHQQVLTTLLRSFLADAAVQREVLQAQAGVPANYDVLNEQISSLRDALFEIRVVLSSSPELDARRIQSSLRDFGEAVSSQEDAVERFKSASALTHNSERVFSYVAGRISDEGATAGSSRPTSVLRSAVAITNFAERPGPDAEAAARSALADLRAGPALGPDSELETLFRHGTLLVDLVPVVNDLAGQIEHSRLRETIWTLRRRYLDAYADQEKEANHVQVIMLGAAVALALYNIVLVFRLDRGARRLEERLSLERAAALISSRFLSLPWRKTSEGVTFGLRQLVAQLGGEEGHLLIVEEPRRIVETFDWPLSSRTPTMDETRELFRRAGVGDGQIGFLPREKNEALASSHVLLRFSLKDYGQATGYLMLTSHRARSRIDADDRMLLGIVGDILRLALERSHYEEGRQKLQTQLARAQRLEALGTLAASVAHEFNNILGAIRGHGELAVENLRFNDEPRRHVAQVLVGSARAQAVIDKILTFGRHRSAHLRSFDAAEALTEALTLLRVSLSDEVRFCIKEQQRILLAGDVTEFQQVILNLCTNAAHAMAGSGSITIGFSSVDIDETRHLSQGHVVAGGYALLEIADHGCGIPAALLDRVFDPFFTTKGSGVGTGLGLSTVRDIATAWGGGIDVSSLPAGGTSVQVYLPLPACGDEAAVSGVVKGNGEIVLLVEIDPARLERDEEMLAALGYEPIGFQDADQALAALATEPERFELAIVDAGILRLSGPKSIEKMASLDPALPILLMVEPNEDIDAMVIQEAGIRSFLAHPLEMDEAADVLVRYGRSSATGSQWVEVDSKPEPLSGYLQAQGLQM